MDTKEQLRIISRSWGDSQGYCFFPWIPGDCADRDERRMSWNEGPAFRWPRDREKILAHMEAHRGDDLYWSTMLFEEKIREQEYAVDETSLWADLDEQDPRDIEDAYRPTVAWETSPGRYQALWIIGQGDWPGAADRGGVNQKLTYYLNADRGGWNKTRVLRIPGWRNHKPEYRKQYGPEGAPGKLLWWDRGRRYFQDDFDDLPDLPAGEVTHASFDDTMAAELDSINRREAYDRHRLKLSQRVRELILAREASGDRSERLWEIERELADAGASPLEIVKIARGTVWNKHEGRRDEVQQLLTEAMKAIGERPGDVEDRLREENLEEPLAADLWGQLENLQQPRWIVRGIWAEGSCGFIAGEPKSYKTWFGLDLMISVASGAEFLDHFPVERPGPVLLVEEEDSAAMVKRRLSKVLPGKGRDKVVREDGPAGEPRLWWLPGSEVAGKPPIDAILRRNVTISSGAWQEHLDETLSRGHSLTGEPYVMLVLDPLMMIAGDVEENRAQKMTTEVFKPLKQLAEKHAIAVVMVHHMRKGTKETRGVRGGQMMLGSVANHAWSEDSMYLRLSRGDVTVERESKHDVSFTFRVGSLRNKEWTPVVHDIRDGADDDHSSVRGRRQANAESASSDSGKRQGGSRRDVNREQQIMGVLASAGTPLRNSDIAVALGMHRSNSLTCLQSLKSKGLVTQSDDKRWAAQ